jgi:hypothetical protein
MVRFSTYAELHMTLKMEFEWFAALYSENDKKKPAI